MKLEPVMLKYEQYCAPKKNITYERYLFFSRHQDANENIDQYVTELRTRSQSCEFDTLKDGLIRDMIVIGVKDNKLRESLLQDAELTLDTALKKCRAKEQSRKQAKELVKSGTSSHVDTVNRNKRPTGTRPRQQQSQARQQSHQKSNPHQKTESSSSKCGRCGKHHKNKDECKALKIECFKCGKKGHFATFCLSKKSQNRSKVDEINDESDSDQEYFVDIHAITHELTTRKRDEWVVKLPVNKHNVSLKLDTGAQVNILPHSVYKKLKPRPKLQKSFVKLRDILVQSFQFLVDVKQK
ncbi:uncharacterized protein [Amphiura filiformis]|uniref:uncharacterized protein n=1 Tax=Amphiura filiformis TaxID=82378 RepID=UPI003B2254BF